MIASGEEAFSFANTFDFNDSLCYWITASDKAGNINTGFEHGPFIIDDNAIPQVTFGGKEYGNGTVEFNATVIDWPNNQTTVSLHYTQDYFSTWTSISMVNTSPNSFAQQVYAFDYNRYEVWYYITANDSALNLFTPSPDQYLKIDLTDKVSPEVTFTITNSSENDGEITITAWAIDSYGRTPFINNTFYVNFTTSEGALPFEMEYDLFNFYIYSYSFKYGEQVTIFVATMDEAGNIGSHNRTIIIEDFTPPKIKKWGINEYQNGTVTIWAEIEEDPNGCGLPEDNSSILIEYVFISLYRHNMEWNGSKSFFTFTVSGFKPDNAFTYRITAIDKSDNSYTTEWIQESIFDQTPPSYTSFGYSEILVNHSHTQLDFWIDASDSFGSIEEVLISVDCMNGTDWLNHTFEMQNNGSFYTYSFQLACNRSFNYHIYVSDKALNAIEIGNTSLRSYWGPVIIEANIEHISETELIVWAKVSDYGSGVAEVILEYELIPYGGSGGSTVGINKVNTSVMDFNGSVYLTTITFKKSGTFNWSITARDSLNQFSISFSPTESYNFNIPVESIEWSDLIPLLTIVGIVPVILVTFSLMVRKRRQTRIQAKRRKQKAILDRFSDIFSLRAIICRNRFGLTFYTENFVGGGQDEDMIAGLATAVTGMVTDIAQREIRGGEFDTLEREGFSILSYHGDHSIITLISEEKLSSFMKTKMKELVNQIESHITKEDLEILMIESETREKTLKLVYEGLPVGLLQPLTLDNELLKQKKKYFKKEKKWFRYVNELPSFVDAQLVFYAMTFITSLTTKGIPLVRVYRFLEDCYDLSVIRNLSEAEMRFFGTDSSSSGPDLLAIEE
jgi:hypothetical protein